MPKIISNINSNPDTPIQTYSILSKFGSGGGETWANLDSTTIIGVNINSTNNLTMNLQKFKLKNQGVNVLRINT